MLTKVTEQDLNIFITKNQISKFEVEDNYLVFKFLNDPVQFAISKVINKFMFLPLERSDFETIAWFGFCEAIKKYGLVDTKKTFISYVIDNVYWRCFDYALTHINNHHKILNAAVTLNPKSEYTYRVKEKSMPIATKVVLDDYFLDPIRDPFAEIIFTNYVEKISIAETIKRLKISRQKHKKILNQVLNDLSRLLA